MKCYGPFDHHNYQVVDANCCCSICTDWRVKHAAYMERHAVRHSVGESCGCAQCKEYYEARSAYVAAMNRRDIYSESSWHAAAHKRTWGGLFMGWLKENLTEPDRRSRGWWEGKSGNLPMSYWFVKFDDHMVAASGQGWVGSFSGVSLDTHLAV